MSNNFVRCVRVNVECNKSLDFNNIQDYFTFNIYVEEDKTTDFFICISSLLDEYRLPYLHVSSNEKIVINESDVWTEEKLEIFINNCDFFKKKDNTLKLTK